jgi:cytochrome P450
MSQPEADVAASENRIQTAPLVDIDLARPELVEGGFPHEFFTRLRREAPVWYHAMPGNLPIETDEGFWVLSKHADIQAANRDTETFCAIDGPGLSLSPEMRGAMLVSMDGQAHIRQRKIISAGFTPRMVGRLEQQARRWAVSIVDRAIEKGSCDFVADVAYQLPMHMIADIVGIPVEDRQWLFTLTNEFLQGGDSEDRGTEEARAASMAKQVEMFQYAQKLCEDKRKKPEDDVWTIISTFELEDEKGDRSSMSEIELNFFFMLLTIAGSETTRNAISGGLLALLDHPDQLEQMRNDPDVMRSGVEEIIRWTSPVAYFARRATRDVEIRGVKIAEGQRITLWYPSANRDEEVFEDPFRFDIRRKPNPHIAFGGGGAHFCLGANLARREIAILFEELLKRANEIEVLEAPRYRSLSIFNPIYLALTELPVRIS